MEKYAGVSDKRFVLMGTCGWTDDTLIKCSRFYPSSVKTAVDRLRHYSRHYPCVEVDTSTYAIPRRSQVQEWMSVVPPGFLFHVKAFGLFPSRRAPTNSLPRDIRAVHLGGDADDVAADIHVKDMQAAMVDALWERFNSVLDLFHEAGKLGVVVFQFHANFMPSNEHIAYVAECRRRLRPQFLMGVEFRSRNWFSITSPSAVLPAHLYPAVAAPTASPAPDSNDGDGGEALNAASSSTTSSRAQPLTAFSTQRDATLYFMRQCDIINIASDDLAIEYGQHEPKQPYYPDGRILIADDLTSEKTAFIRLHRRRGDMRLLSQTEVVDWADRMQRMAASADGVDAYFGATTSRISGNRIIDGVIRGAAAAAPSTTAAQSNGGVAAASAGGQEGRSSEEGGAASSGALQPGQQGTVDGDAGTADAESHDAPNLIPAATLATSRYFDGQPARPLRGNNNTTTASSGSSSSASAASSSSAAAAAAGVDPAMTIPKLKGPIFYLIGTDWEDQPMLNLKNLAAEVDRTAAASAASAAFSSPSYGSDAARTTRAVMYDWKAAVRDYDGKRGLLGAFARQATVQQKKAEHSASESGSSASSASSATVSSAQAASAASTAASTNEVGSSSGKRSRPDDASGSHGDDVSKSADDAVHILDDSDSDGTDGPNGLKVTVASSDAPGSKRAKVGASPPPTSSASTAPSNDAAASLRSPNASQFSANSRSSSKPIGSTAKSPAKQLAPSSKAAHSSTSAGSSAASGASGSGGGGGTPSKSKGQQSSLLGFFKKG